eukprot:5585872-Pleurochrysis_carterae.AAC.1
MVRCTPMTKAAVRKVTFINREARAHPATGRTLVGEPSWVAAETWTAGAWSAGICALRFGGVSSSSRAGPGASAGSRSLRCGGGAGCPVAAASRLLRDFALSATATCADLHRRISAFGSVMLSRSRAA